MFRMTTVSKKLSLLKTDTSDLLWQKPLPQSMGIHLHTLSTRTTSHTTKARIRRIKWTFEVMGAYNEIYIKFSCSVEAVVN